MDEMLKKLMVKMAGEGTRLMKNSREWRVPYILYADDLVFCDELEESLRELMILVGYIKGKQMRSRAR